MANENLQNALDQAGLTLEAFAEVIQVDPKSVQRWVSGSTVPYPKHRAAVSRALNLSEHELWPEQIAASPPDEGGEMLGGCDVVRSWAYADDDTAPDLLAFITDSDGPIDLLESYCGIELTAELADALAAQAAAGRPVRILTGTPSEHLGVLIGEQQIEVRLQQIWVEFWFIRAGEQMLFAINFQDDVALFPPPVLALTGSVPGGLFDRAQTKFDELWQQAQDDPDTLLTTRVQLDQALSYANGRERGPADRQNPRPEHDSGSSAPVASPPGHQPTASPSAQTGESFGPEQRRWPRRPA